MKWFKHDGNARGDSEIEKLLMKYGVEGYGLYFYCVEIIAGNISADNITFELKHDAETIAHRLKMDTLKVEEIMRYMVERGLFQINPETKRVMCLGLAKRLDNSMRQCQEIKNIIASPDFKRLQDTARNLKQIRLEENRKEEDICMPALKKKDGYSKDFETFWNGYPRKVNKAQAYRCWRQRLKDGVEKEEIMRCLVNYRRYVVGRDVEYILHAATFLNKDCRFREYAKPQKKGAKFEEGPQECPECHSDYWQDGRLIHNVGCSKGGLKY